MFTLLPSLFIIAFLLISLLYYLIAISSFFIRGRSYSEPTNYPHVTVHIPVYNDPIVERLLNTLLEQDYPRFDIIVVDDSDDPHTRSIIDKFSDRIKIIRRESREGFKAGALNEALKYTKGEIIVVFDSDFVPPKNFLKEIVRPFQDPKISYVQARWTFENLEENLITVFAGVPLLMYHHLFYPLLSSFGIPYISGTAFAIRKNVLEEVGGWRNGTLTEDGDLSMRLIARGFKGVYLPHPEVPSLLPNKLRMFCIQQQRWSTGMLEALFLNVKELITSKHITPTQKVLSLFIPSLNFIFPVITGLVFISLYVWSVGITLISPAYMPLIVVLGSGYVFAGVIALYRSKKIPYLVHFLVASYIVGPVLSFYNTGAMLRKLVTGKLHWVVTPKVSNVLVQGDRL